MFYLNMPGWGRGYTAASHQGADDRPPAVSSVHYFLVLAHQCCRVICRYYQSTKSLGLSSNLQPTGAKADHLREEMEEAANRMEICRVSHQLPSRHISSHVVFWGRSVDNIHLFSKLGLLLIGSITSVAPVCSRVRMRPD